jgi:aldehyde dehydrogenase (NAD+)
MEDLGKSKVESFLSEITVVYSEIRHTLKNMDVWVRKERQATPYYAQPANSYIVSEPKGVVLIMAPWNYPFQLLIAPLVSAIAAGNVVIVKAAHESAHTARVLQDIIGAAFDEEQVYMVQGKGAEVIPPLLDQFPFDHIFFTGSSAVGRQIMKQASKHLSPVTLELGGKSPGIVDQSANLKVAARRLVNGKFINTGQTCIAPDHIWVHESVKDEFIHLIRKVLEEFYGPDPKESNDYGRIIHAERLESLIALLDNQKIILGGEYDREELYMAPTLVDSPRMEDPIMNEEIFGPIWPILTWNSEEDLLQRINRNPDPLACYIFTERNEFSQYIQSRLSFGGGCINNTLMHLVNPDLPFGGIGNSGMGAYHGKRGFDTFSHQKSMLDSSTWVDPSVRYPPYNSDWLPWIKKVL